MLRRFSRFPIIAAAVLAVVVPSVAGAQDDLTRATVTINMRATARTGPSRTHASNGPTLKVGEAQTVYFNASAPSLGGFVAGTGPGGPFDPRPTSGGVAARIVSGSGGVTPGPGPLGPGQYQHSWHVQVKLISVAVDLVTFEVDWKRFELVNGTPEPVAGDVRTVKLRQDERHVLDFLALTSPDYANVEIEMLAAPTEEASTANVGLAYDLWLVHETREGAKITRHATLSGRQGEKVAFKLDPVPLQLDANAPAEAANAPFRMYVEGAIAGRVRADGSVEISLQPTRSMRAGENGGAHGDGAGAKVFVARLDETTSIELPNPTSGSSGFQAETSKITSPRPGVTVFATGTIRVDTARFFANSKTAILVTVKRRA